MGLQESIGNVRSVGNELHYQQTSDIDRAHEQNA